jgi:hypothetical protein
MDTTDVGEFNIQAFRLGQRLGKSTAQAEMVKTCLDRGQRVLIGKHTHYEIHYKVGHLTRIITHPYSSNPSHP